MRLHVRIVAVVAAATLVVVFVCGPGVLGVIRALVTAIPEDTTLALSIEEQLGEHRAAMDIDVRRFNGRSPFYRPRPPRVPVVVIDEPEEETEPVIIVKTPDPEPPPPERYLGPPPIAVIGDEVWFRERGLVRAPLRLHRGESGEGVELLDVRGPRSIRVRHLGGEYEIGMFKPAPAGALRHTNDRTSRPHSGQFVESIPRSE